MRRINQFLLVAAVALVSVVGTKTAIAATTVHPPHRPCPEDAVWVGRGDYHDGYWESYFCWARDGFTKNGDLRH